MAPGPPIAPPGPPQQDLLDLLSGSVRMKLAVRSWHKHTANRDKKRTAASTGMRSVAVLYGSETGTAESYARKLAVGLRFFSPAVASLNEAATPDGRALLISDLVLIVTSTFGAGQAPLNAARFLDPASPAIPDLRRSGRAGPTKLAVCALGSSVYHDFARFGRTVWARLFEAGAEPLMDLVTADQMTNQHQSFEAWMQSVTSMVMPSALALKSLNPVATRLLVRSLSAPTPALAQEPLCWVPAPREQYKLCPVVCNLELREAADPSVGRSTRRIELDIRELGPNAYETGDHLMVLPVRPASEVAVICAQLGVSPHDVVEVLECTQVAYSGMEGETLVMGGVLYEVSGTSKMIPYHGMSWLEVFSVAVESALSSFLMAPLIQLLVEAAGNPVRGTGEPVPTEADKAILSEIFCTLEAVGLQEDSQDVSEKKVQKYAVFP